MSNTKVEIKNLNLFYGNSHVLKNISFEIFEKNITALIGPSGCGKTTFLRCINRLNDIHKDCNITGEILINKNNIYDSCADTSVLRKNVGMVFQKPNLFPMNIYDNIAYGPRVHGTKNKKMLDEIIEDVLKKVGLWQKVCDKLDKFANCLSGGEQQRLCIARAIAISPEIILMDEPTSALDPMSTLKIEDLINELRQKYTVIIITHNMQQASRISDMTAFFLNGELIEYESTCKIFSIPKDKRTDMYITGKCDFF